MCIINRAVGTHWCTRMYVCAQECGANLSEDAGALASPNWPHNYAHHQHCVWNITVTRHKVCMCGCVSVSMHVTVTVPVCVIH